MTEREKLCQILDVPIYPMVNADPLDAVTDYLLDNDVIPVVRCKDCKHRDDGKCPMEDDCPWYETSDDGFCSYGERKEDNREAHWVIPFPTADEMQCSLCGERVSIDLDTDDTCPGCGAHMKNEGDKK